MWWVWFFVVSFNCKCLSCNVPKTGSGSRGYANIIYSRARRENKIRRGCFNKPWGCAIVTPQGRKNTGQEHRTKPRRKSSQVSFIKISRFVSITPPRSLPSRWFGPDPCADLPATLSSPPVDDSRGITTNMLCYREITSTSRYLQCCSSLRFCYYIMADRLCELPVFDFLFSEKNVRPTGAGSTPPTLVYTYTNTIIYTIHAFVLYK